ncbi:hypothetical protein ACFO4P_17015 [Epilithonimonas pallida]|uniref:Lipoprotein n=1 Tax=Epilithonimonas pallida TaxID=373671 RepID=A0ABY1R3X8_9FLAO|nr:hypothetical protein [Epilithonimonas pallida]SMP94686.1 hypothetical protein SAMN05421679_10689 [Epilithonimonas pallida]
MKKIIYLLISVFLLSCGGLRKTNTETNKSDEFKKNESSGNSKTSSENGGESSTDLSQFLKNTDLEITSKGTPFSLSYNGIVFTGEADVKINNKEEKTIVKTVYRYWDIYRNWNVYHNYDVVRNKTYFKHKETESKRDSWWLYVLLYFAGMITIPLIKLSIKK